jgi:hypothetical protein
MLLLYRNTKCGCGKIGGWVPNSIFYLTKGARNLTMEIGLSAFAQGAGRRDGAVIAGFSSAEKR